jgi:aldose 1-epimerase
MMKEGQNIELTKTHFGKADGAEVYSYKLKNKNNVEVRIINYGGIITHIITPDKEDKPGDVVLGFDNLDQYLQSHPYLGVIVGRFANRISKGKFNLDGKEYKLAVNNGPNHLHGGIKGFDKVVWNAEEIREENKVGVKLSYLSKDMEEGYPGNLNVTVIYALNNENELSIKYEATTDKKTVVNLTNHSYFNLAAGKAKDALDHILTIKADQYTPVDETSIPLGKNSSVKGTPFDFTTPHSIGERIEKTDGGYDHNFVFNQSGKVELVASVEDPLTGRLLDVFTDQPGTQFYSGNYLDGSLTGKGNIKYVKRYGFCLETQHFPDSPNQSGFPSTVLNPGQKFSSETIYKFSVKR